MKNASLGLVDSRANQQSLQGLGRLDESQLIRACLVLGAESYGGPLSYEESKLIIKSGLGTPIQPRLVRSIESNILSGKDPLGDMFCRLRSPTERREKGAFYTPGNVVTAMMQYVLRFSPQRIIDAGCGSGRFVNAALRNNYKGVILAVDLDPVATLMTRAVIAVHKSSNVRVANADFLTYEIDKIQGRTALIGNPPYIRHHDLPKSAKKWAKRTAKDLEIHISGLAGLHALFVLKAFDISSAGDIGCLLTSSEWMDTNYGAVLRKVFSQELGVMRLDVIDPNQATFQDAMATAVVVSWRHGYSGDLELRSISQPSELKTLRGGRLIDRRRIADPSKKWRDSFSPTKTRAGYVPLSTYARVHRGTSTGANSFFTLTWPEVKRRGLQQYAKPCLTRATEIKRSEGIVSKRSVSKYLICLPSTEPLSRSAKRYVAEGIADGVHEGYICSHRTPWWRIGKLAIPDAIATYMMRGRPSFALNPEKIATLNVFLGLYFHAGLPDEIKAKLVSWLNKENVVSGGRTYSGGLNKFEPKELESVFVPKFFNFSK